MTLARQGPSKTALALLISTALALVGLLGVTPPANAEPTFPGFTAELTRVCTPQSDTVEVNIAVAQSDEPLEYWVELRKEPLVLIQARFIDGDSETTSLSRTTGNGEPTFDISIRVATRVGGTSGLPILSEYTEVRRLTGTWGDCTGILGDPNLVTVQIGDHSCVGGSRVPVRISSYSGAPTFFVAGIYRNGELVMDPEVNPEPIDYDVPVPTGQPYTVRVDIYTSIGAAGPVATHSRSATAGTCATTPPPVTPPPPPAPVAPQPPVVQPPVVQPPVVEPPAPPASVVKVKAVKRANKLFVNVNPNKGKGYWKFKIQKKKKNGSWRTYKKKFKTFGKKETRTINRKKGTYRVVVLPKYGLASSTSAEVRLRR